MGCLSQALSCIQVQVKRATNLPLVGIVVGNICLTVRLNVSCLKVQQSGLFAALAAKCTQWLMSAGSNFSLFHTAANSVGCERNWPLDVLMHWCCMRGGRMQVAYLAPSIIFYNWCHRLAQLGSILPVPCCAAAMMLSGPSLSMCDRTVYLLGHLRTLVSACVLLILGKWLYSSKPSDVTDLFWTGSRNSRTATAAGAGGQECRLLVRPSVRPEAWAEWRLILSQEAETAALLFHGSGTGSESVVVVMVGGGGWNYLVRCQSSQHFGMQHSKRSTPRCFLSPPAHIHHPESCQPYCCVCMCVSLFFILSRKTPPTNTMFHQVHEDNVWYGLPSGSIRNDSVICSAKQYFLCTGDVQVENIHTQLCDKALYMLCFATRRGSQKTKRLRNSFVSAHYRWLELCTVAFIILSFINYCVSYVSYWCIFHTAVVFKCARDNCTLKVLLCKDN